MSFTDFEIAEINTVTELFPEGTELSVAKIINRQPFYYGTLNSKNGVLQKNNSTDVFEIGSISKVFTAHILAKMVVEGKLALDATINSILPVPINNDIEITLRELATHTSGLPRLPPGIVWQDLFRNRHNPYKNYTENKLLHYLQNELKLKDKGKLIYSNLGAGLLGYALAKFAETSYDKLVADTLFCELNMCNSATNRENLNGRLVPALDTKGRVTKNWDLGVLAGAGSVLSCTEDMVKFVLANFDANNHVMNLQRKAVFESGSECLALGWFIVDKKEKGERMYFHNGGTGGYSSAMLLDIKSNNAFIVLSNVSGLHKFKGQQVDNLVFNLMSNVVNNE